MNEDDIRTAIQSAIEKVQDEPRSLNFQKAHERSIAHRLAVHMECYFRDEWDVDCEYDRDGTMKKTLIGIAECNSRKRTDKILPDIIVHKREQQGRVHNLLVVELKKNAAVDPCDSQKLKLMTQPKGQYQYQLGLYININGGKFTCTWYRDGQLLYEQ